MKLMKSKLHGFCHAYNGNDEKYLRDLGWVEESESFPGEEVEQVEEPKSEAQAAEGVEQADKPRRGRKPKSEA